MLKRIFEFNILKKTKILDRLKERFSDGCGYDYITSYLKMIASKYYNVNNKSANLLNEYENKLITKKYYEIFNENIITPDYQSLRKLPIWVLEKNNNNIINEFNNNDELNKNIPIIPSSLEYKNLLNEKNINITPSNKSIEHKNTKISKEQNLILLSKYEELLKLYKN